MLWLGGLRVLEIACGTGRNLHKIGRRWPGVTLHGLDISAEMLKSGACAPQIRAQVRTGDTSQFERAAMRRINPHILVTTPESLYLLLTSASGREMLQNVRTVIVDEIHAVAQTKRGAHLSLTLERLAANASQPVQRIGLSATQKPIEEVAKFLVGQGVVPGRGSRGCSLSMLY